MLFYAKERLNEREEKETLISELKIAILKIGELASPYHLSLPPLPQRFFLLVLFIFARFNAILLVHCPIEVITLIFPIPPSRPNEVICNLHPQRNEKKKSETTISRKWSILTAKNTMNLLPPRSHL